MKIWRYFFLFGLIITLVGLVFNLSQQKDYQCVAIKGQPASDIVSDTDGNLFQLPFSYRLEDVISEKYTSGAAKSHPAKVVCCYHGKTDTLSISENHPARYYQYDFYLRAIGKNPSSRPSAEIIVSQSPAQSIVYIGLIVLIFTSLGWVIRFFPVEGTLGRWALVLVLSIVVLSVFIVFNPMMQSKEVPPILRSRWFIPHVVSYVFSYAILLAGFISAVYADIKSSSSTLVWSQRMLKCGTGFFTIGLALGIVWAKEAWGTFWNWDPKETMALITYGYYLFLCVGTRYIHFLYYDAKTGKSRKLAYRPNVSMQFAGLLFLILCWTCPQFIADLFGLSQSLHNY
jgi:hypothetical protein